MKRSSHASHRLTHEENRLNTCVLCWRRGGRKGSKAVAVRPVTAKLAATLRRVTHHTTYNLECPSHPGGICTTDLKKLLNVAKSGEHRGSDPRVEWRKLQLADIEVPDPDITWDECSCPMCHLGHYNPVAGRIGRKKFVAVLDPAGGLLEVERLPRAKPKKKQVTAQCTLHQVPGLAGTVNILNNTAYTKMPPNPTSVLAPV